MGTILNQSKQNFRCIGLVNELNLEKEDCEIKVKDKNGNDAGTKDGERIKGSVAVRMKNGVKTFNVFVNSLTTKGEENKQWKNALAMLDLNPEIGGDSDKEASLVSVTGRVDENSYLGQDGNVKTILRWSANRISTSRVDPEDEHGCTLSGNFYIKSVRPETKDDEETGRLLVTLCAVGYGATPILIDTIVNEDLAEAFEDIYEVGQTAPFDIDVVMEHIGGSNTSGKKKFGSGGAVNVNSGYDKETLIIVGGDEPIEEPEDEDDNGNLIDNGWIDSKAMKIALKERDTKLAEIKENGGKEKETTKKKSSLKDRKKVGKPVHPAEDDDDNPFDNDLDDDF